MPSTASHREPPTGRGGVCIALLLACLTSTCDLASPVACTGLFVYGIVVTAVDSDTGEPVTEGLRGVTIRGSESAEMEVYGNTLRGAGEEEGRFAVIVTATGYDLWTRTGIEVEADECHVIPVERTARLTAASSS